MIPMFRSNKKGVSPLIATILLIAFAIALGTVIMNWGRGELYSTPVYDGCKAEAEGYFELTFNNPGNTNLSLGDLVVKGSKGEYKPDDLQSFFVEKEGTYTAEKISYDFEQYGDINQVTFSVRKAGKELSQCKN